MYPSEGVATVIDPQDNRDMAIHSLLENILVDTLGYTSLNCAIGGALHEIVASTATLDIGSQWKLPELQEPCDPAPIANCWNHFFSLLKELPEDVIGPFPSANVQNN